MKRREKDKIKDKGNYNYKNKMNGWYEDTKRNNKEEKIQRDEEEQNYTKKQMNVNNKK